MKGRFIAVRKDGFVFGYSYAKPEIGDGSGIDFENQEARDAWKKMWSTDPYAWDNGEFELKLEGLIQ